MRMMGRLQRSCAAAFFLLLAAAAAFGQATARVSSARELVRAIGPQRTVVLAPGDYDLSRARDYRSLYIDWRKTEAGDDYELVLKGVSGLTLRGEVGARIVTPPPYAYVLTILDSGRVRIEGLEIGHSEPGYCVGGVLRLERCGEVTVEGGALWGSGAVGVDLSDCMEVTFRDTDIRECTAGAVRIRGSEHVTFDGALISENEAWPLIDVVASCGVSFDGCTITGNRGAVLFAMDEESEDVSLYGTEILYNDIERFTEEGLPLPDLSETVFEDNAFVMDPEECACGEEGYEEDYEEPYEEEEEYEELDLPLPEGWGASPSYDRPGAVLLWAEEADIVGLFAPLSAAGGDPRADFRRALEELREAMAELLEESATLQAGPLQTVDPQEQRQEVYGTSEGPLGATAVRGQIVQVGGRLYATVFSASAAELKARAGELEEAREAAELLISE